MSKRLMHNGLWSNLLVLLLLALGAGGVQAKERVTYFHNDLLGSPVAATDSQGTLLWQEEYTPYGKRLSKEDDGKNSRWYTGKSEVAGLGVQYFDARWYDAELGRFLSIDPVDIDAGNIRSFNRYAYANNNPYRYVDPNGESPLDIGFLVVDVVKLGVAVYSGVGVAAAAADVGMSVVGVLSPVPGTGLALKGLRTAKMAKAVDKASAAKGGTYKLRDADGAVKRTGKSNDLDRRRSEHARNKDTKDLDFEVDRRSDCCNAQRGREQIIYDKHPEAQAANGGLNKRRPVSPTNPKRDIYRKVGEKL